MHSNGRLRYSTKKTINLINYVYVIEKKHIPIYKMFEKIFDKKNICTNGTYLLLFTIFDKKI